jgi:acetyl esterase
MLAGESAGANLVTALAYCATHPRPESFAHAVYDADLRLRGVLPIYGLLDLHELERFDHPRLSPLLKIAIHRAAAAYVGRPVRENAPRCPLASPLRLLAEPPPPGARALPPFFAACGTADPLLCDSKRLKEVIEARGASCELSVHPKEIHGFNAMIWRRAARAKWRAAFRFISRHLDRGSGHAVASA